MSQATENQVNNFVGQQLKKRRKALKLSQSQLGEILGITYQQVQKYESGNNKVSPDRLVDLSKALDTPLSYFFEGIEHMNGFVEVKPHESTQQILVSQENKELIENYNALPTDVQRHIREFIAATAASFNN